MSENNGQTKALTTTTPTQLAQFGELSVQGIVDRKRKILEVMQSVMADGVHYGKIPGTGDKPTLYKSGAEILATTFALAPEFAITKTDLGNGHREYEITCTLVHIPTGLRVGSGVGSCSTLESKYRWRRGDRVCPECGKAGTVNKSKQKPEWYCWAKKGGCGMTWPIDSDIGREIAEQNTDRVENPDIADQWNTVLKMAKKRAQVDATLTATGASDLLTQDLEDLPPGSPRDRIAPDIEDAEFTETDNGSPSEHRPAPRHSNNRARPNGNGTTNPAAIVDEVNAVGSYDELRRLIPKLNSLPKGSPQRKAGMAAFKARETEFQQAGAA